MRVVPIAAENPGPWTGTGSWTYFLPGRLPTLVDAGSGEAGHVASVEAVVAARSSPPHDLEQVLVTHGHPDHAGGAEALAERWPAARFAKFPSSGADAHPSVAWRSLADEEVIDAGDATLWVLHTPGHAPDHVCYFEPASGVLFSGDLVVNGGTVVVPPSMGGNMAHYLTSLRRVLELAPRRIFPGHGAPIDNPAALLRGYIAHRLARERQVVDALADGCTTPAAIVDRIYLALDGSVRGAALENVVAHLGKLEEEGRARRESEGDGDCWRIIAAGA